MLDYKVMNKVLMLCTTGSSWTVEGDNSVTCPSSLFIAGCTFFCTKKNNDALASTGHKARVNSNIIVSLLDQEVYFAFLTLLSNVFLGSVSTKEEKLSTLSTRREEAS